MVSKGKFVGDGAVHVVSGADGNPIEVGQNIHFGQSQLVCALHANAVTGGDYIKRTDSSGPPGGGAVFSACFPQSLRLFSK